VHEPVEDHATILVAVKTVVYTDGACSGNPGPGGWAWAVEGGAFASGAEAHTTNQRMELTAALEAVRTLDGAVEVVSDSTYVVNCFRDRWWEGWLKRGWTNSQKKPVANRDLWEPLIETYRDRGDVTFRWVKGHHTDPMNDLVDRLAVEAALKQAGRTGSGRPADLGPPDMVTKAAKGPALPEGHAVYVTGVRPPELGGYGPNPHADRVRARLQEILEHKSIEHPDLLVVTGLALGAEQLGAEAAVRAGLPYVAVVAHEGFGAVWSEEARAWFEDLRDGAALIVTLDSRTPETKAQAAMWQRRRDQWIAERAAEAIVVGEPDDEAFTTLVSRLGEDQVFLLHP
jgi:ribonuclease HI